MEYTDRKKNYMTLEELNKILNASGFVCLGHGTGRSGNSDEIVASIFKEGLRTKDNSLYLTTIGLDTINIESLKNSLNNWQHLSSKKIILIRIPIDYINILGDSGDLDGERFGAFYNKKQSQDGKITYYLDPRFIVGCYDTDKQQVLLNEKFEKILSEETLKNLKTKYIQTLEKTKERIKRQENALNILNSQVVSQPEPIQLGNSNELDLGEFDDVDWIFEESDKAKKK